MSDKNITEIITLEQVHHFPITAKAHIDGLQKVLLSRERELETLKALHIDDLCDLDREIKGLEVENNGLRKKRSKGQINEAYAELIEKQDIERQKQALKINQLRQKNKSLLADNEKLEDEKTDFEETVQLLAGKLKEAAEWLRSMEVKVMADEYCDLANQFIDGE